MTRAQAERIMGDLERLRSEIEQSHDGGECLADAMDRIERACILLDAAIRSGETA